MQIKSEPPDYGYNQLSPPQHGYHSPIPQPAISPPQGGNPGLIPPHHPHHHHPHADPHQQQQDHINILNITSPWSQAMKTMNQETNLVISNSLLSSEDEFQNFGNQLKYSTAGGCHTETTHSMTSVLAATQSLANSSAQSHTQVID